MLNGQLLLNSNWFWVNPFEKLAAFCSFFQLNLNNSHLTKLKNLVKNCSDLCSENVQRSRTELEPEETFIRRNNLRANYENMLILLFPDSPPHTTSSEAFSSISEKYFGGNRKRPQMPLPT